MSILPSAVPYIKRRIFVGGLPSGVTEEECKQCFEKFGKVVHVIIIYRKEDRKPRGFGFITFDSDEVVQRVIALRFLPLNEKMVEVKRAEPYIGHKKNPYYYYNNFLSSNYDPVYYSDYFPYYFSFYNHFPLFYASPYTSLPVHYNYYPYVHEVEATSVILNGNYYGPSTSIDSIQTSDRGRSNSSTIANYSNGIVFDSDSDTFTETVQNKFVDSMEDYCIGSCTLGNTKQNEDVLAYDSEVAAKFEEKEERRDVALEISGDEGKIETLEEKN